MSAKDTRSITIVRYKPSGKHYDEFDTAIPLGIAAFEINRIINHVEMEHKGLTEFNYLMKCDQLDFWLNQLVVNRVR